MTACANPLLVRETTDSVVWRTRSGLAHTVVAGCSCTPSPNLVGMCRNITTLRGLEPAATPEEIEAAARQFVRKISGVQKTSEATEAPFERAVATIMAAATELLDELPARRQPPPTLPPLRRIAARSA